MKIITTIFYSLLREKPTVSYDQSLYSFINSIYDNYTVFIHHENKQVTSSYLTVFDPFFCVYCIDINTNCLFLT